MATGITHCIKKVPFHKKLQYVVICTSQSSAARGDITTAYCVAVVGQPLKRGEAFIRVTWSAPMRPRMTPRRSAIRSQIRERGEPIFLLESIFVCVVGPSGIVIDRIGVRGRIRFSRWLALLPRRSMDGIKKRMRDNCCMR